jgi:lysyl-tRNA synthetase class 2
MNCSSGLRFLRPYLATDVPVTRKSIYIRFFNTTQCRKDKINTKRFANRSANLKKFVNDRVPVELRIQELEGSRQLKYPRIKSMSRTLTVEDFKKKYDSKAGEERTLSTAAVNGRVTSVRIAGKALVFIDIVQDSHTLQVVCRANSLRAFSGVDQREFSQFYHRVRRGDIICECTFVVDHLIAHTVQLSLAVRT